MTPGAYLLNVQTNGVSLIFPDHEVLRITKTEEGEKESGFDGRWWLYLPLRNALAIGLIAGAGFVLAHLGLIVESIENVFYWIAIPLDGWHWTRDGIKKLTAGLAEDQREDKMKALSIEHAILESPCDGDLNAAFSLSGLV